MAIEITRSGKHSLTVETPVMPAAGTLGFGDEYRKLINMDKLGAFITNPVTYEPWSPSTGTRIVPLDAGVLVHTGLPNPGLSRVLKNHRDVWGGMPMPVILHLVATTAEHVRKCASRLDEEETVDAIELGLPDDLDWQEASALVSAATRRAEKPVLVCLPLQDAAELAETVVEAGADALVIGAAPRGTARDPLTGKLVSGRIYGPLVKPMALRTVGMLMRRVTEVPIIGCGGIHSPQDARDFLEAGARAVQVDSVTWIKPRMLERIARDLGGWIVTRATGAFPDEWHPDMGDTEQEQKFGKRRPSIENPKGTSISDNS